MFSLHLCCWIGYCVPFSGSWIAQFINPEQIKWKICLIAESPCLVYWWNSIHFYPGLPTVATVAARWQGIPSTFRAASPMWRLQAPNSMVDSVEITRYHGISGLIWSRPHCDLTGNHDFFYREIIPFYGIKECRFYMFLPPVFLGMVTIPPYTNYYQL